MIKKKKTKRISPYLENELWEKEDLLNVIKYEPYKRNKEILSLLWDLSAGPYFILYSDYYILVYNLLHGVEHKSKAELKNLRKRQNIHRPTSIWG
jgi:hypothetical protein